MAVKYIYQEKGPVLGYSDKSGIQILEVDGLFFKDLNQNGRLDPYEDWRLPIEERVTDLVSRMSVKQIAGLMLYSKHQAVSSADDVFSKMFAGHYDGKTFEESEAVITDLSDEQKQFLDEDELRHLLITTIDSSEVGGIWVNNIQEYAEALGLGIPVNISTDPRHAPSANTEFNAGAGGDISKWPEPLGLAATFSEEIVQTFGEIAAKEYRALGITTALSPQIDIATDPRWMRFNGTFGEDTQLASNLGRAYIDGFQTTEATMGWGEDSVNAMVKHWPGGGSGEAGRDAHYGYGKYAVYPTGNFNEHLQPFLNGAFKLKGGTQKASAVMPYYTISYDQDLKNNENVGNSYSEFIIQDLLRETYSYEGVVCTDWMITQDNTDINSFMEGKSWGVDELTEAERHYKILMAGVDQFGGNNEIQPVLAAYDLGVKEHGESWMRQRFELSAKRLLKNIFRPGLVENPYVNIEKTKETVGNPDFMKAGYEAQLQSIVMLKNKNMSLPIAKNKKVFIPKRRLKETIDWFGNKIPAREVEAVNKELVSKYFDCVAEAQEADFSLIFIDSPNSIGYDSKAGYLPISLQYRPYKAIHARLKSIAGDRSYKDKENIASNEADLDIILETRQQMGEKPIIVIANTMNPFVVAEFEPFVEGIFLHFNVQTQAILDNLIGKHVPSGLLPFQMPQDMETVEKQNEDVGHDMVCYQDSEANTYDFAFGLDFKGIIEDRRVIQYKK